MNVAYINPFLSSTIDLFQHQFGVQAVPAEAYLDARSGAHRWDISAIMVLTGNAIGVVALRLTRLLADKLLVKSGVEWESEDEREALVNGLVGELVNIIGGNAAGKLTELSIDISVPIVVQGKNHTISWPDQNPIIAVPFSTNIGPFQVNVSIMELPKAYRKACG